MRQSLSRRPWRRFHVALVVVCTASSAVFAGQIWHEEIDGDLSGDYLDPTEVYLQDGHNTMSIHADVEYFTFTLADGQSLDAVVVDDWDSEDDLSFVAIASGTVFTSPRGAPDVTTMLGWDHFGVADEGNDILQNIGNGAGTIGFDGSLGAGSYTVWLQETGADWVITELDFVVSSDIAEVPEPTTVWMFGIGLVGLLVLGARARKRATS